MIIIDTLLIGGIKFVLSKIAAVVDRELNDDAALREELLAAQMRLELGEISERKFAAIEAELLARLRAIRERRRRGVRPGGKVRVASIEARLDDGGGAGGSGDAAAER